ncbi:hypothetical protein PACTADRAFT_48107 [Pachysolen tannophilus NRRL Y-2460]|uniref:Uncharacterized protein n=1 Tax=Pachysolen tannophilus NRRL Y-2460 TaxID=669874 RepID=A0A1E4U2U4_PACTA|nr:hypothetical protein PACTADRAFT_48107 [Pachysolen tannophilus NRRL Y-2460]
MSSSEIEEVKTPKAFPLPSPFWNVSSGPNKAYQPVDPFSNASKLFIGTGVFVVGMHFRRLLQRKKGSARPGLARYLEMFEMTKAHLIGIPLGVSSYSFLHDCLQNVYEKETAFNEFLSSGIASFIGVSIIKNNRKIGTNVGTALGIGLMFATMRWAGGFAGLDKNSHRQVDSAGLLLKQEDSRDIKTERQGFWDLTYRRPLSQTIEDLGEGRGILRP